MKFASARAKPAETAPPALHPAPVHAFTLVYETRGAQSRGRLILPDGTEETTEWRTYDHGMVAQVHALYQKWRRAGILGSLGRVPKGAERSR